MKEQILKLSNEGFSYREIKNLLGCSLGTISYHLGNGQKEKTLKRTRKFRKLSHPYYAKLNSFLSLTKPRKQYTTKQLLKAKALIYNKIRCFHGYPQGGNMSFSIEDVIDKFGENPKCYLTGEEIDIYQPRTYEFDHKIPRSRGGENTIENLGIATSVANDSKRDMTPTEYIGLCAKILKHNGYNVSKCDIGGLNS